MAELVSAGKVRHLGLVRSRGRRRFVARTRCIRSPRCRPSTRSGRATSRRTTILPTRARARHRLRRLQSARPRISRPGGSSVRRSCRRRLSARNPALSGRELRRRISSSCAEVERLREEKGVTAGAARAGVGAVARRRHRADSRHQAREVSRGERGGREHHLTPRSSTASTRFFPSVSRRRSLPRNVSGQQIADRPYHWY